MAQGSVQADRAAENVEHAAQQVADQPWVAALGRFGYAARGAVYLLVGILAAQVALGTGGQITDQQGALQTVGAQPFGALLLWLVALGLVGYALWRLVQAAADTEGKGREPKGLASRAGYAISGLLYGALAISAVRLALGAGESNDGSQTWTAQLMAQPFGRWLVALVGLAVIGVALFEIYKGVRASFRKDLKQNEMSAEELRWATIGGRAGYIAHGLVLSLTGLFLIQAALRFDANRAAGLDAALQAIRAQPTGPWLLTVVALGLVSYGLYSFVEARYRRMAA